MSSVALQKQITGIEAIAGSLTIASADDYLFAKDKSEVIARLRGEVNSAFDPIIAKAHAAHKEALAQKKRYSLPLEQAQKVIDSKMLVWDREQIELRRQELEKQEAEILEALAEGKPLETVPEIVPAVETPKAPKRVNWKFRIVDVTKIPREFLCPDLVKLGEEARTYQELAKVAGVEFYTEETMIHRKA